MDLNELAVLVEDYLGVGYRVYAQKVMKNNVSLDALSITKENENVAPIIYVSDEDEKMDIRLLAKKIVQIYQSMPSVTLNTKDFQTPEFILKHVQFYLIGKELNEDYVSDKVYKEFLDMYLLFLIRIDESMTFVLTKRLFDILALNMDSLCLAAFQNTKESAVCIDILDIPSSSNALQSFLTEEIKNILGRNMMKVLTNKYSLHGAACMLASDKIEEYADIIEDDVLILPSSIHECLLIPLDHMDIDYAKSMVRDINATMLEKNDILTNSVYLYSRNTKQITLL